MRRTLQALMIVLLSLTIVPEASANIGLPLIAVFLPPMWVALLPIILLEAIVYVRLLGAPKKPVIFGSALANVVSTIVGIPIMWVILATIELIFFGTAIGLGSPLAKIYAVTVQAPWLISYEKDLGWMVPSALASMAIPCIALSVLIEGMILRRFLAVSVSVKFWRIVLYANLLSYLCLALLFAIPWAAKSLLEPLTALFYPVYNWLVTAVFYLGNLLIGPKGR